MPMVLVIISNMGHKMTNSPSANVYDTILNSLSSDFLALYIYIRCRSRIILDFLSKFF
jgi:hypothetical protein